MRCLGQFCPCCASVVRIKGRIVPAGPLSLLCCLSAVVGFPWLWLHHSRLDLCLTWPSLLGSFVSEIFFFFSVRLTVVTGFSSSMLSLQDPLLNNMYTQIYFQLGSRSRSHGLAIWGIFLSATFHPTTREKAFLYLILSTVKLLFPEWIIVIQSDLFHVHINEIQNLAARLFSLCVV